MGANLQPAGQRVSYTEGISIYLFCCPVMRVSQLEGSSYLRDQLRGHESALVDSNTKPPFTIVQTLTELLLDNGGDRDRDVLDCPPPPSPLPISREPLPPLHPPIPPLIPIWEKAAGWHG